jgi:hypothetical protein
MEKETLIDQLHLLRSIEPGARLHYDITSAMGDTVTARVELVSLRSASYAGIVLPPEHERVDFETLKVRDGNVTERWGAPLSPLPLSQVAATTLQIDPDQTTVATLRYWSLGQQSSLQETSPYPILIVVLSESLSLNVMLPTPALLAGSGRVGSNERAFAAIRSTPVRVEHGSAVFLPAGTQFTMRNSSDRDLQMIVVELTTSSQPFFWSEGYRPRTFFSTLLARGVAIGPEIGELTVAIARLSIEPGRTWMAERVPGGGELVAVLNGSVRLQVETGLIWTADDQAFLSADTTVSIDAAQGAAIDESSEVVYQAMGTEEVDAWVVALIPAN